MYSAQSVTATIALITPTLYVPYLHDALPVFSSSPAGINCGATCSASFAEGTMVTLTATAAAGSTFTGWSGGGCSGTGTCSVSMGADQSVTARFALITHTLTV